MKRSVGHLIDLNNKVVLVTGGSRGIGSAIVKAITAAGGDAIIHYAGRKDAAEKTASEAGADHCFLLQGNLAAPRTAGNVWSSACGWRGHIDILVNNAGIFQAAQVDGADEDWDQRWHETLQVNLKATADWCRAAINHWRGAGTGGTIINISSRAAHRGDDPAYWAYAASKGGMVSLTKTIARGFASDGVLAYGIAPGFVATDMAYDAFHNDPDLKARVTRDIPLGDIAPVEDIAHTVCFLAAGLAPHATGTTIDINGASYVR
jgi:NAD(P)-dependent dehydrogenase (short-subunit alcohol dehydrogenase family)